MNTGIQCPKISLTW